jgi:hypothetical protein
MYQKNTPPVGEKQIFKTKKPPNKPNKNQEKFRSKKGKKRKWIPNFVFLSFKNG